MSKQQYQQSAPATGDMFNTKDINDLDRKINEHQKRPSLIADMKRSSKATHSTRMLSWENEWRKYWYVYVFLAVSSIFTGTLGIYMGLSPTISADGNMLTFHTDIAHVLLALIFCIAFVTTTEVAFGIGKWLFFTREERNMTQKVTTLIMMVVASFAILGTGIAGGMVIASNISFLTKFVEIPAGAQKWVVVAIPTLIVTYTALVSMYSLSSDTAASERLMFEKKRESDLNYELRKSAIDQIVDEQLQGAELKMYMELVGAGKMSAATARAAMKAGITLDQLEKKDGKDYDGNGDVGTVTYRPTPQPRSMPQPQNQPTFQPVRTVAPVPQAKIYTVQEILDYAGFTREQFVAMVKEYNLQDPNKAYGMLHKEGYLPNDLTHSNFVRLWNENIAADITASPT